MLTVDEQLYLVAPRGDTRWAKNARAAGVVTLHRSDPPRTIRCEVAICLVLVLETDDEVA